MDVDIVIIGLNAAKTLRACLESVSRSNYREGCLRVFYVDSGSVDDSIAIAKAYATEATGIAELRVLMLESEHPSPGAGRNQGWRAGTSPLVQFLDSDTELHPDWLVKATELLKAEPSVAAVRGNRRERHPEASFYNWVADLEWNAAPGVCSDFGGDVLILREILERTGGYDETLVGGEDPELSQRVRKSSKNGRNQIHQLDEPMTNHDMAMHHVLQYWKRGYRTGYGFGAVLDRHPDSADGFWKTEFRRILVRGGGGIGLMLSGLVLSFVYPPALLLVLLGLILILYPRLFRIGAFASHKNLSQSDARRYAWHCSWVVVPEFFGILRYRIGKWLDRPLRNRRSQGSRRMVVPSIMLPLSILLLFGNSACTTIRPGVHDYSGSDARSERKSFNLESEFQADNIKEVTSFASEEELASFSRDVPPNYEIGPGDVLSVTTRGRPEASADNLIVSPDGKVSIPRIGILDVGGTTIEWLTERVRTSLVTFYEKPEVSVMVTEYKNNKVFVLGRVASPGLVQLEGGGTLLEALASCGGLPTVATEAFLTRAMVFRGNDKVIWVNLRSLLNDGNTAMNPRLRNNDLIFIPESDDELVFVMGAVANPGAVKLKTELSIMDAVMAVGGPTRGADKKHVYLVRNTGTRGYVQPIDLGILIGKADFRQDYLLKDGDIIYVSENAIEKANYVISQLSPSLSYLDFAQSVSSVAP
jgi:protein involved in polysaccharide export with SLBB domain/glycosyltransferase involved in cell wall biosynthesis